MNETLSQPIISLLKFYFNSHVSHLPLDLLHRMNNLLSNNKIISDVSTKHKTTLVLTYQVWKNSLDLVYQGLSNYLIDCVAKSNRQKLIHVI